MSTQTQHRFSTLAAGLALFSMFFGAGDLIWPLILGGGAGDRNFFAMLGLLITGVSLPLLGLISMMMFEGDYRAFFGRIGKIPGIILIFIIQAILGPLGSIPRLITLSYATLQPYLPPMSLVTFSILAGAVVLALTIKKQRIVDLLGLVLTPILLLSLGFILVLGFINPPTALESSLSASQAFRSGLNVGYNTLDLIASFIFAPLVLFHFKESAPTHNNPNANRRRIFKKMIRASLIAAGLLSIMYVGLTYIASYYTPVLDPNHAPESRLAAISLYLLGPQGAFVSCIAVAMTCLTTAIPITSICGDYIRQDLMRGKGGPLFPLVLTLGLSCLVANLGFIGIAQMLSPILQILCPGLIVLSALNIGYRLYEIRLTKVPVFVAFAISTIGYML
jgi:branched-chain amino acid:cation transporter, LIVCS family